MAGAGKRWVATTMAGATAAATVLLSACATAPIAPGTPSPSWAARVEVLRAVTAYSMTGRLAVARGNEGFSAGLHWRQNGPDAVIDLSAPLGFGAAHIERRGALLTLTDSHGQALVSDAAAASLRDTLGFEPPLDSLRYWLLGVSDPASPAQPSLDAMQRLVRLQQNDWQIDYADYVWTRQQWLPRRLVLMREDLRLRLVINDWQL